MKSFIKRHEFAIFCASIVFFTLAFMCVGCGVIAIILSSALAWA
jgi:hypothetical protein